MLVLAVVAQLADLLTKPAVEANPLVVALGPSAWAAKLLLLIAVVLICAVLATQTHRRMARIGRRALVGATLLSGTLGTTTNLLTTLHWHP